ncbi:unnamed protein product [Protopolystoma xenopodis]|uniref:Uncharacterized protein n=1 Tax=Protopolystoma xenopodis TaxID=117903 RepID=A0A3S5AA48_9PLAT|nr:unnamed protein product [Protopolystoma xenopodis]
MRPPCLDPATLASLSAEEKAVKLLMKPSNASAAPVPASALSTRPSVGSRLPIGMSQLGGSELDFDEVGRVVRCLTAPNEATQYNAAAYLQHLTFQNAVAKGYVR